MPVGTTVDTRKGTVEIKAAGDGGTAKFFDGIFKISQTKGKRPLTTLTLTETLSCPKGKKAIARRREEEVAQAVGRREGRVPDEREVQRGDRARHEVAGDGPLRQHDDEGHAGVGDRA